MDYAERFRSFPGVVCVSCAGRRKRGTDKSCAGNRRERHMKTRADNSNEPGGPYVFRAVRQDRRRVRL